MRFLLDTHIWLWGLLEPKKLPPKIAIILQQPESKLFISPISVWETVILAEKGKISVNESIHEWIFTALRKSAVEEAILSFGVALKSRLVVLPHQDPADRFIVASAWEYNLILITLDEKLQNIPPVTVFQWK